MHAVENVMILHGNSQHNNGGVTQSVTSFVTDKHEIKWSAWLTGNNIINE